VVPKTVHEDRMIDNIALIKLNDMHMTLVNELAEKKGTVRYLDPRNYIGFDIFCEEADEPAVGTT
jgi:alcohol dehydrogenase (NADP+)